MDVERELYALTAEAIATQFVLTRTLIRLRQISPELNALVRGAFDDAANIAENTAIHLGKASPPEQGVKTLRVVEEMRAMVFSDKSEPKHAV